MSIVKTLCTKLKKVWLNISCALILNKNKRDKERKLKKLQQRNVIGRHSYFGDNLQIGHDKTTIGSFCSIAGNVCLGPGQHPTDWLSTHPFQYFKSKDLGKSVPNTKILKYDAVKPVHVGNDVWIGTNVVIKDGVTLGNGCIVGSSAVVTHDVPPYAIVGGIPAKIIRYRFTPEIIAELEKLKWWELPDDKINKLRFDDIKKCIKELKEIRKEIKK